MWLGYSVLGLFIGSFLNVCIDRFPRRESLLWPRSHCEACECKLSPSELVPVLSYLLLRGRCRHCGVRLPVRYLLVELGTGLLFAQLWLTHGPGTRLFLASLYGATLIVISGIDVEHQLIPNRLVYPTGAIALAAAFLAPHQGFLRPLGAAVAGLGFLWLIALLWPGGIGMGDAKLAGLAGLVVGLPGVFLALWLAFVLGGLCGGVLLLAGRKSRKDTLPFGLFLAVGVLVTMLYGEMILSWYIEGLGWLSQVVAVPFLLAENLGKEGDNVRV